MNNTPNVKPFFRLKGEDGKTDFFKSWQWQVIICSMIGYSIFYFVRKNFSFAMPALAAEYGIGDLQLGSILTAVGVIYGISKFLNGILADRSNARWHLVIGLGACVVLNFIFGWSAKLSALISGNEFGPDFVNVMVWLMAILLVLNNVFQGCGFAPCNRLMVHWVPPTELATKMSIWNTSHSIGAGIVSVLCGAIIGGMGMNLAGEPATVERIAANLGKAIDDPAVITAAKHVGAWQWCFWIPALIGAVGVFFILTTLRDTPTSVGLPELKGTKTALDNNDTTAEYKKFVKKRVFGNPVVWALAICDLFVYIVRFAVLDWGPKFLQQGETALSPQLAGWTIAIFEIAGCAGMLAAGWATDKLFKSKGQRMCLIEMFITALCLVGLWLLPKGHPVAMLVLLAVSGFFLYGPQALLGVVASNHVTKKAASSAVGLIGLMSYVSTIFTGFGVGLLSKTFGNGFWNNLFLIMAGVAVIGGLIVLPLWNMKNNGYESE